MTTDTRDSGPQLPRQPAAISPGLGYSGAANSVAEVSDIYCRLHECRARDNALIYDTDTARFVDDVIERSRSYAVAVDFWAPWCGPCRALAPILEQLVGHYGGRLAVAGVNTDAEPALAGQYGIRSIPDVRIFRNGRMVDGFVGVQPLARLLPIFDKHVARASEKLRTQAQERLRNGDVPGAVALLRQLLAEDPNNTAATVDLADALARLGKIEEAEKILEQLPANESTAREVTALKARLHFVRHAAKPEEVERLRAATTGELR